VLSLWDRSARPVPKQRLTGNNQWSVSKMWLIAFSLNSPFIIIYHLTIDQVDQSCAPGRCPERLCKDRSSFHFTIFKQLNSIE
jgi:hypothetical protein